MRELKSFYKSIISIYLFFQTRWSDSIRAQDPAYFCRKAIESIECERVDCGTAGRFILWIVTDARRKTDLEFFRANYSEQMKCVRVVADEQVRIARGWKFTKGLLIFFFCLKKRHH